MVDTLRVVRRSSGLWLVMVLCCLCTRGARADAMALQLSRLSRGACERTLSSADDFALTTPAGPTLTLDRDAYAMLVAQLSGALAPPLLAPVTTRGPSGFDLAFAVGITDIDQSSQSWQRGTRGSQAKLTCDGRNTDPSSVLAANQLRFVKGLPLGISLGGSVGFVHGIAQWTIGTELKVAIIEGVVKAWVPSVALRVATSTLVGDADLSLSAFSFDVLASREFAVAHVMQVVPYVAVGALLSRASGATVDLTPNIDAAACAAGRDAVCNAQGLGASSADLEHQRKFPTLLLMRYRALLGVWLRYRLFAFAAEASVDLVRPDRADSDLPSSTPRQWSVTLAPSLSF
jgi:hypothetical protein